MVIFNTIITNFFNDEHDNNKNNIDSYTLFKIIFLDYTKSNKDKFVFFMETLTNVFLKTVEKDFVSLFCKFQKIYHSLNKFVYLCKFKKSNIVVNTNMCLNEININDKNVICIFQKNCRYLFDINDIIKIINNSLTSSYLFFVEPKPCKNPYNNLIFEKATLYNIYFFIKYNTFIYPELVFKFFECNFNLSLFLYKYESLARDYLIKNFVNSSTSSMTAIEIKKMIAIFNNKYNTKKIYIHNDFPQERLIKIFRPYLFLHLTSNYSFNNMVKNRASIELKEKLFRFNKFNPKFGRKIIKSVAIQRNPFGKVKYKQHFEFMDAHINFNPKNSISFLQDHTTVNIDSLEDYTFNVTQPTYNLSVFFNRYYFNSPRNENNIDVINDINVEEDEEDGEEESNETDNNVDNNINHDSSEYDEHDADSIS